MNLVRLLFSSSIGRKILMAVTGLVLVGFVVGHLIGNLQIFAHPDQINGYAQFLHSLGPVLWLVRIGLLGCVGIHVWAAVVLSLENKAARGPEAYGVSRWIQAAVASRYMKHSGLVVLAFIIYHLAHFTAGAVAGAGEFKASASYTMSEEFRLLGFPVVAKDQAVQDIYSMVFLGFRQPAVAGFYIIAVALLSLHLLHGVDAMCQTLGLRNHRWAAGLRRGVALFSFAYLAGNVAIPSAILTGMLAPAAGTVAAQRIAAPPAPQR